MRRNPLILIAFAFLVGCTDQVEIRGPQSRVVYSCAEPQPAIASAADRAVVLDLARRIVRYETEDGRADRVTGLSLATSEAALEIALATYGCSYGFDIASRIRFPDRGSAAPVFTLPVLDDGAGEETLSLADLRGSIAVLNFWATWCKPCLEEYPELQAVSRDFESVGVQVVGVLHRDSPAAAREWVAERGGGFPVVIDADNEVTRAYQVNGVPQTFVVDRDGNVERVLYGYSPGLLRQAVEEALARGSVR